MRGIILASDGREDTAAFVEQACIGAPYPQYHISLWDTQFAKSGSRGCLEAFRQIGIPNLLRFDTEQHLDDAYAVLKHPQPKTIVVHGGNSKTIINRVYELELLPWINYNLKQGGIYVGWSAGIDVATHFGIANLTQSLRVHWNMFIDDPENYNLNVHGYPEFNRLPIRQAIAETTKDIYLMPDGAFVAKMGEQDTFYPYGEMWMRKGDEWFVSNGKQWFPEPNPPI